MAVAGIERRYVRQHVGRNLMGAEFIFSTTSTAGGDAESLICNRLTGGADNFNGWWIWVPGDGVNGGEYSKVYDTLVDTPLTGDIQLKVRPAFSTTVPSGMIFEAWKPEFSPVQANDMINRAVESVYGRFYTERETRAFHGDGTRTNFILPSYTATNRVPASRQWDMVKEVQYRTEVDDQEIDNCETVWTEYVDTEITITADTEFKKKGSGSLKFNFGTSVIAGAFASNSIDSTDFSDKTHVEFWVYSDIAIAAGNLHLLLDDTAACVSPVEAIALPELLARTWTRVIEPLANPELDTAIISIGFRYTFSAVPANIWLDDIRAVNENNSVYTNLPHHLWRLDSRGNDLLVLTPGGRDTVGYSLMKVWGGSFPVELTSDTDLASVDETYLVEYATAQMLMSGSPATVNDPDGRRTLSDRHLQLAQMIKGRFPLLVNVRKTR